MSRFVRQSSASDFNAVFGDYLAEFGNSIKICDSDTLRIMRTINRFDRATMTSALNTTWKEEKNEWKEHRINKAQNPQQDF
jgi:hypothetical protein